MRRHAAGLALPHLRLGRRRQVDADRPAALRAEADLRRSARGARARFAASTAPTGEDIDFALLLDGLEAEREQGITIDVAYRSFATPRRAFIVADTPGPRAIHPQHGDRRLQRRARRAAGRRAQGPARPDAAPRHHRRLLGIRHVVLAVNKIDLVDFDRAVFERIVAGFRSFAAELGFKRHHRIPISARYGDNVSAASGAHAVVRRPASAATSGKRRRRGRPRRQAVPAAGAMGQPAQPRFPRLCRHHRRRQRRSRRRDRGAAVRAGSTRVKSILAGDGEIAAAQAGDAVTADARATRSTSRAATCWPAPRERPAGRRPVRRASGLDGERHAAARAAPI